MRQSILEGGEGLEQQPPGARSARTPAGTALSKSPSAANLPGPQPALASVAIAAAKGVEAASGGPATPPEQPPTIDGLLREHSEEPGQAILNAANKLGGMNLAGPAPSQLPEVKQQVPAAAASSIEQPQPAQPAAVQPPVNPFSSAFAYTERMNSAFTSGA